MSLIMCLNTNVLQQPCNMSHLQGLKYLLSKQAQSSFVQPRIQHQEACKRLLRHLKGTIHFGVQSYTNGTMQIHCFMNSDWACNQDDRKSVADFAIYLGPNLVSWSSQKQSVVSRSSIETESSSSCYFISCLDTIFTW